MNDSADTPDHSPNPLVRRVLLQLPERDAAIVAYRFGINDGAMHTLDQTAGVFGVDTRTIRSLETTVVEALHAARGDSPDSGD